MRGSSYANFNRWNVSCSPKVSRTTDRTRVERENGHQNLPCGAADRFPERPLSCWKTCRFQRGDLGLTESPSSAPHTHLQQRAAVTPRRKASPVQKIANSKQRIGINQPLLTVAELLRAASLHHRAGSPRQPAWAVRPH